MAKSSLNFDEVSSLCTEPDPSTKDFIMQQTMLRIKDPRKSLEFYSKVLGMRLLAELDFPAMSFSLFFMGYAKEEDIPKDKAARTRWAFLQPGCIELTYNYGTDTDESFKGYHNGNADPRGFGHIGICVPDVEAACKRFEEFDVEWVKKPSQGKMSGIAFIKDPDGYWIEILSNKIGEVKLKE